MIFFSNIPDVVQQVRFCLKISENRWKRKQKRLGLKTDLVNFNFYKDRVTTVKNIENNLLAWLELIKSNEDIYSVENISS